MKLLCGLGNPGSEYEDTRHNVGWWVLDRARETWRFPAWRREGQARVSEGRLAGESVLLLKPLTYMNRSGSALLPRTRDPDFDVARDLLVLVDETALDVGRARLRAQGSPGGHNGLKSIEAVLRTSQYARLRVGVGAPPPGVDRSDWVLSPFLREDGERILELVPALVEAAAIWVEQGVEAAANRVNR